MGRLHRLRRSRPRLGDGQAPETTHQALQGVYGLPGPRPCRQHCTVHLEEHKRAVGGVQGFPQQRLEPSGVRHHTGEAPPGPGLAGGDPVGEGEVARACSRPAEVCHRKAARGFQGRAASTSSLASADVATRAQHRRRRNHGRNWWRELSFGPHDNHSLRREQCSASERKAVYHYVVAF